jgi:hypothetical protein
MTRKQKTRDLYRLTVAALGLIWVGSAGPAHARGGHGPARFEPVAEHRSREVPREFEKTYPCPSVGSTSGACPGYVRDDIIPLCAGGADATWNMEWQTVADGKAKNVTERQACNRQR